MIGILANLSKPLNTLVIDTASTNITAAAWAELITAANMTTPASAIEVYNYTGYALKIGTGAAGSEVAIPYTLAPGGASIFIPIPLKAKVRIAAKSADPSSTTANSGLLIINFFG